MSVFEMVAFVMLGVVCGGIVLTLTYILSVSMRILQDKAWGNTFKIHTQNTTRCGGVCIFIALIIIVMAGLEISNNEIIESKNYDINKLDSKKLENTESKNTQNTESKMQDSKNHNNTEYKVTESSNLNQKDSKIQNLDSKENIESINAKDSTNSQNTESKNARIIESKTQDSINSTNNNKLESKVIESNIYKDSKKLENIDSKNARSIESKIQDSKNSTNHNNIESKVIESSNLNKKDSKIQNLDSKENTESKMQDSINHNNTESKLTESSNLNKKDSNISKLDSKNNTESINARNIESKIIESGNLNQKDSKIQNIDSKENTEFQKTKDSINVGNIESTNNKDSKNSQNTESKTQDSIDSKIHNITESKLIESSNLNQKDSNISKLDSKDSKKLENTDSINAQNIESKIQDSKENTESKTQDSINSKNHNITESKLTESSNNTTKNSTIITPLAGLHLYISCFIIALSGMFKDTDKSSSIALINLIQVLGILYFNVSFVFLHIDSIYYNISYFFASFIMIYIIINAFNVIDGINGNAIFTALLINASIIYVAHLQDCNFITFVAAILLGVNAVFAVFNFPFGKMFLGDSGAYLLGFILSALLTIGVLYAHFPLLYALSLFIYPLCEFFACSFSRAKKVQNLSLRELLLHLCEPNNYHLHFFLYARFGHFASVIIAFIYAPFVAVNTIFYKEDSIILLSLGIFCVIYGILFRILRTKSMYLYNKA